MQRLGWTALLALQLRDHLRKAARAALLLHLCQAWLRLEQQQEQRQHLRKLAVAQLAARVQLLTLLILVLMLREVGLLQLQLLAVPQGRRVNLRLTRQWVAAALQAAAQAAVAAAGLGQ